MAILQRRRFAAEYAILTEPATQEASRSAAYLPLSASAGGGGHRADHTWTTCNAEDAFGRQWRCALAACAAIACCRLHAVAWCRVCLTGHSLLCRLAGIILTNDGNAILREIDVAHPAAKVRLHASCPVPCRASSACTHTYDGCMCFAVHHRAQQDTGRGGRRWHHISHHPR